jgi:hypothetical protein
MCIGASTGDVEARENVHLYTAKTIFLHFGALSMGAHRRRLLLFVETEALTGFLQGIL